MPDVTRQSLLLREELHAIYRRAVREWPAGAPLLLAAHRRSEAVDNGIAGSVYMARSGASSRELQLLQRHRDAERKRAQRRGEPAAVAAD